MIFAFDSIRVNPRYCKRGVTSYYLTIGLYSKARNTVGTIFLTKLMDSLMDGLNLDCQSGKAIDVYHGQSAGRKGSTTGGCSGVTGVAGVSGSAFGSTKVKPYRFAILSASVPDLPYTVTPSQPSKA